MRNELEQLEKLLDDRLSGKLTHYTIEELELLEKLNNTEQWYFEENKDYVVKLSDKFDEVLNMEDDKK